SNGHSRRNRHQIKIPPATSNKNPAWIILRMGIRPVPYTIAFGGVETGNTKAKLAAIQAARTGGTGEKPAESAMAISTGTTILVAAVLEANSVNTSAVNIPTAVKLHTDVRPKTFTSPWPSVSASPVSTINCPKAMPPPNRGMVLQGILVASFHDKTNR